VAASAISRFARELRRRRVFRTAGAYLVAAWLGLQAASILFPAWEIPEIAVRYLVLALLIGFPVALVFGWMFEITLEGIRRTLPSTEAELRGAMPLRPTDYLILGAFVLVAGAILYDATGRVLKLEADLDRAAAQIAPDDQHGPIRKLAVLPLVDVADDPQQEYFADGMTEALIAGLSRIRELKIMSLSSVMRFKRSNLKSSEIAGELGADGVIEGSVERINGRVKLSVQLVDARTDTNLWLQHYERDLTEIQNLQHEVAETIGEELRIQFTAKDGRGTEQARSVNAAAYDAYLRGRFHANRQTRDNIDRAIEAFRRAIALDPEFGQAHAELAQAYVWKFFLFSPEERIWEELAFMAVEKARALDPDLGTAYLARGRLLWTPANRFPHELAIREFRQALALNPELDEARNLLALVYSHIGLFEQALHESREALDVNPGNHLARYRIAQTHAWRGQHEAALDVLKGLSEDVNPALVGYQTAWVLINLGRNDEATVLIERLLKDYPEDTGGLYASMQAILAASAGRPTDALEWIELAVQRGRGFGHFHHTAYQLAVAYALIGESGLAINWLQNAASDGFPCYPLFSQDPNLDVLREDSRFIALLAELQAQWERFQDLP
jgi:adenylate cyclase